MPRGTREVVQDHLLKVSIGLASVLRMYEEGLILTPAEKSKLETAKFLVSEAWNSMYERWKEG